MQPTTYVFRLDDISWQMNTRNFHRIRDVFIKYKIKPLIGVIPDNKDEKLIKQADIYSIPQEEFWEEIRTLANKHGWAVALHGLNHIYRTKKCGMFHINNRSEFAAISYAEQDRMICEGRGILEAHGIITKIFMAPAHSLDWNTVAALRNNDFEFITDGLSAYPYRKKGIWFIPQVASWPDRRLWGIQTVCLHINEWTEERFVQFETFLKNEREYCRDYPHIIDNILAGDYEKYHLNNFTSKIFMRIYIFFRRIRYQVSNLQKKE